MHFNKVLLTLVASMFAASSMFVVSPVVVYAADDQITQDNTHTGDGSVNTNKTKVKRERTTVKETKAKVKNKVSGVANTGGNVSKHNTTGGSVDSGDVTGTVGLTNAVNQHVAECCCPDENGTTPVDITQTNDTTGHNSTNRNRASVRDTATCVQTTLAKVKNDVSLVGNTGGNKAIGNTTSGNVNSGDVTFGVTVINTVN